VSSQPEQSPPATSEAQAPPVVAGDATLNSWGNIPVPGEEKVGTDLVRLTKGSVLSRGLGRSYGDSSFPPASHPVVTSTVLADRIIAFDEDTGILRAEAGLCLRDLVWTLLPRGWFTPVTPGTWYVTLGGMVASDVHGKNHHSSGCFGEYVRSLRIQLASGDIVDCSMEQHADLFLATIGGMGLTGHILEVEVEMQRVASPWIYQETFRIKDMDHMFQALHDVGQQFPMTVAWMDCFKTGSGAGRGHLNAGRWATPEEAPAHAPKPFRRFTVPDIFPSWTLNNLTGRLGYSFLYHFTAKDGKGVVHPETFFTPLDKVLRWNRGYGSAGLTQYQCVIPFEAGAPAAKELLALLRKLGVGVYLAVVKDCGAEGRGMLSFPRPGLTLALDLKVGAQTPKVVGLLNERVIEYGGRVYLTKDRFSTAEHFRAMEPRLDAFLEVRRRWDPEGRIRSAQSVRLLGDAP
jgi:FAD/FMN-containing dehydrogenase